MPSVVELSPGRLLCVVESVQVASPHAGVIRQVTSDDGGRTWSWERRERAVVYEPSDKRFAAYAPWLARLPGGALVCVFGTNEERPEPSPPGAPPPELNLDIKYVCSGDSGRSWSPPPATVYEGSHHNYMPGVLPLKVGRRKGALLFLMLDYRAGYKGRIAEPEIRSGATPQR